MTEQDLNDAVLAGDWERAEAIGHRLDGQRQRATLAQAALWYAAQGVPVFPCRPRGKQPITSAGFRDATCAEAKVREWWARTPAANIGAACGWVFDVLDVDGPEGVAAVAPMVEEIRAQSIGIVSTPRPGGLHYYLPRDPRRRNSAKRVPGLDWRAAGGYVLLPPSITDEHGEGRSYRWLRPLTLPAGAA